MARRVTCPKCGLQFSATQYEVHKFTHHHDLLLRKDPIDASTSRLLPIEVSDDDDEMTGGPDDGNEMMGGAGDGDEMMEDMFEIPAQTEDHSLSPSSNHNGDFPSHTNPFSDNYMTASTDLLPHNTPIATTSHTFPLTVPSNEDMETSQPSSHSEDSLPQGPLPGQPSPLIDEELGFEDSGLDPTSGGNPSLSEQLKARFLAGYHGGGEQYWDEDICIY